MQEHSHQPHQPHQPPHQHDHASGHGESGGHQHPADFSQINVSFVIAVSANLAFTIIEAVYGWLTNSVSLLGDAGHNLSDVLGLLLAWGAAYLASRKSSVHFSYGYRKTTILAALTNSMVLVLAAGYIAWESISRFVEPSPVMAGTVIVVAGIGILVNAGTALLFMKGSRNDLNLRGAFLHLAYDAAISAGVLISGVMILYTDALWIDPVVGLLIVVVILMGTWGLLRDSVNLILDAVPAHIDVTEVRDYLAGLTGVTDVHDLHIWAMSTSETCLTAHLVMPDRALWEEQDAYARIRRELESRFHIHHMTLQVEKDRDCPNDCDDDPLALSQGPGQRPAQNPIPIPNEQDDR